jgi:glycosyltransferase involved in cell wall biosynthesis
MSSRAVSVIVPSYNSGPLVTQAIDSALAQTLSPAEVIVVDDGSKDDTSARMEPYIARGVTYIRQENQGVAASRNAGIARATGCFVAFLDADDVWHPQKLKIQMDVLAVQPFGMLGTSTFSWPGTVPEARSFEADGRIQELQWRDLLVQNHFVTSSILMARSTLDLAGAAPFDVSLSGPEDHDLWIRIAEHSRCAILDLPLTGYRAHAGGLGSRPVTMEAGMRRILGKLDASGAWKRSGRLSRRKAYSYFCSSSGYMYGIAGDHWAAISRIVKSLSYYPFPFRRTEVRTPLVRLKILASNFAAMVRGSKSKEQVSK